MKSFVADRTDVCRPRGILTTLMNGSSVFSLETVTQFALKKYRGSNDTSGFLQKT